MPRVALVPEPSCPSSTGRRPDDPGAVLRRERDDAVLVELDPGPAGLEHFFFDVGQRGHPESSCGRRRRLH